MLRRSMWVIAIIHNLWVMSTSISKLVRPIIIIMFELHLGVRGICGVSEFRNSTFLGLRNRGRCFGRGDGVRCFRPPFSVGGASRSFGSRENCKFPKLTIQHGHVIVLGKSRPKITHNRLACIGKIYRIEKAYDFSKPQFE